jgi:hypothetical protein
MSPLEKNIFVFILLGFFSIQVFANEVLPEIKADQSISTSGYFQLSWHLESAGKGSQVNQFIVQQSRSKDFEKSNILYQGSDTASLISGLPDGKYFYRVQKQGQAGWSNVVQVDVQHHSLGTAVQFFFAGLLVFIATLFMILKGVRQSQA